MKTKYILMISALALILSACSSDETNTEQTVNNGEVRIIAKLAPKDATALTRAISLDKDGSNKDIVKATWAENEKIAIIISNNNVQANIDAVNSTTGEATISFSVPENANNKPCTIVYPYSAAKDDGTGVKDYAELLSAQDGTLNANLDVRVGTGTIHTTPPNLTVSTQPAAQFAICEFKLTDGSNDISATRFVVEDGNNELITAVTPSSATNTLYVALPAATSAAYRFAAKDASKFYSKTATGTLSAGTYYQTTVSMAQETTQRDLALITTDYTAGDGETLTGTLTGNAKMTIAAGATVTLKNVYINPDGKASGSCGGIECLGNATINLSGNNDVRGYNAGYPGIYVPSGSTLTISGTGTLRASPNDGGGSNTIGGAGIGAKPGSACGNIEIQGGTINAHGGVASAGIGGYENNNCGDITISGGIVTATGIGVAASNDNAGAGIGSGYQGTCGTITITGGTIDASSNKDGAAIGSGVSGTCGNISISGGIVSAISIGTGAGIGCGYQGKCGTITITSGVTIVSASTGGTVNSIGRGNGTTTCGTITIGGTEYWNGSAYTNSDCETYLKKKPLVYPNNTNPSITVHDGTDSNVKIPLRGTYNDSYQKNEFIIPRSELTSMNNMYVYKMTFYPKDKADAAWNGNYQVFLKEVDYTTFSSSFSGTDGATTVYTGILDASGSTMDITFSSRYQYKGGDLLVGIYKTEKGFLRGASFYGTNVATNSSVHGYNYSSLNNITSLEVIQFIPKTTFSYWNTSF